jgi:hypothetical protein
VHSSAVSLCPKEAVRQNSRLLTEQELRKLLATVAAHRGNILSMNRYEHDHGDLTYQRQTGNRYGYPLGIYSLNYHRLSQVA